MFHANVVVFQKVGDKLEKWNPATAAQQKLGEIQKVSSQGACDIAME